MTADWKKKLRFILSVWSEIDIMKMLHYYDDIFLIFSAYCDS